MSVIKGKKAKSSTKGQSGSHGNKTPLLRFQNLVSTITITRSIQKKALLRRQNENGDLGKFEMSHSTSPDDDDRRPDTTTTEAATTRSDVLSRINMSDQFRFVTKPNRKFQVRNFCTDARTAFSTARKLCHNCLIIPRKRLAVYVGSSLKAFSIYLIPRIQEHRILEFEELSV